MRIHSMAPFRGPQRVSSRGLRDPFKVPDPNRLRSDEPTAVDLLRTFRTALFWAGSCPTGEDYRRARSSVTALFDRGVFDPANRDNAVELLIKLLDAQATSTNDREVERVAV